MLTYSFSDLGTDSLYEHLYKSIKNDIINGTLTSGSKLPSKRTFAKNLNISTITIENAYAQLIAEGYIYSIPKKGYFVSQISEMPLAGLETSANINTHNNAIAANNSSRMDTPDNTLSSQQTLPSYKAELTQKHSDVGNTSSYVADFLSNNVNHENFPFSIWAKLMRETIAEDKESLMTPLPSGGSYELRSAIAAHLLQFRGMKVEPEQIIIGAGTEYLYGILIQLLGRNRIYAVEDPGYKKISQVYNSNQVTCKYIPVTSNGIDIEALEQSNADIIHISPSHHFPTGIVTPVSKRYELLGWAAKASGNQRYIIEDDYDSEFRLMGRPIPSLQSIDVMERVIYMNSFSKSLASTIRISYMVLPKHLLESYNKTLSFYACTVSTFEQYTLAKFIKQGYFEKHINRMRNHYRNLRDVLINSIKNSPIADSCTIMEEDSGLHFLLKLNTKLSDATLKTKAKMHGINVSCLSDYYHIPEDAQEHVLILNYSGINTDNITAAVSALEQII